MLRFALLLLAVLSLNPRGAAAQSSDEIVWIQIEARPSYNLALQRIEQFAQDLPDLNGFALDGGWYAITLGPYTRSDAEQVLTSYLLRGLIPRDSYIALSSVYGEQYWPLNNRDSGTIVEPARAEAPDEPVVAAPSTPTPSGAVVNDASDETRAEARRSESRLSAQERRDLQIALRWAGYYNSTIDGAFGRGTRSSMAAWQSGNGFEPTGILTTRQRAALLGQYNAILDGLDMQVVTDTEAGIEIKMPAAMIQFSRYEAPFSHFESVGVTPHRVLLISQDGSRDTLKSLYDVMQTLDIVPLEGPRRLSGDQFTIVGRNNAFISETQVRRISGQIKGFTLIWPTGDDARRERVIEAMQSSYTRLPGVLDPGTGLSDDQRVDLISGLEVRKPKRSRSGFYVDGSGAVITSAEAVQSCTRITLDDNLGASLANVDLDSGVAVLKPTGAIAPPAVARFSPVAPRLQSDIAVAGYSFEGQLDAPSITFGTLTDVRGLGGETNLNRLSLDALPGDSGGPVIDSNGNVFGMLLPVPQSARQLPDAVRFALTGDAIATVMQRAGLTMRKGDTSAQLDSIDLADLGAGMTVLVNCWD